MMGEENKHKFDLNIGPEDKKIHGKATFRTDKCIIESVEDTIFAHVALWFETDAIFTWKKKILGARVTKNFNLDCKFEVLANISFKHSCSLQYADIIFKGFKCQGIPKIFTQVFESNIQSTLNAQAKDFLGNNLEEFINNNDSIRNICL